MGSASNRLEPLPMNATVFYLSRFCQLVMHKSQDAVVLEKYKQTSNLKHSTQRLLERYRDMSQIAKAAFVSLTLSLATIATTLGTAEQASALPLLDVLDVPLNAVLGRPQTPPPTRSTDLQLMNGNLNGNNVTLCTITCGLPGLPGLPGGAPPVRPPVPLGTPLAGAPTGGGLPPGVRPPASAPTANRTSPALLLPPIPLPNPFN
jgi:hypothetical protein